MKELPLPRALLATCSSILLACTFGCKIHELKHQVLFKEPLEYSANFDLKKTRKSNLHLAEMAYLAFAKQASDCNSSEPFHEGFVEGFADYLTYGGKGLPPVAPPRKYWRLQNRGPAGRVAVDEWFNGFGLGTQLAIESGHREQQVLVTSYSRPPEEFYDSFDASSRLPLPTVPAHPFMDETPTPSEGVIPNPVPDLQSGLELGNQWLTPADLSRRKPGNWGSVSSLHLHPSEPLAIETIAGSTPDSVEQEIFREPTPQSSALGETEPLNRGVKQ